jgi:hypothetical protein
MAVVCCTEQNGTKQNKTKMQKQKLRIKLVMKGTDPGEEGYLSCAQKVIHEGKQEAGSGKAKWEREKRLEPSGARADVGFGFAGPDFLGCEVRDSRALGTLCTQTNAKRRLNT